MSEIPDSDDIVTVQGSYESPLDQFWLEIARKISQESISALEEAAKQLIGIASLLQGIYFAAVSLSDLKRALVLLSNIDQWLFVIVLSMPIALWLISLWLAILVLKPEIYITNLLAPEIAQEFYEKIISYKHKQLNRAYLALASGFIPLLINIFVYLLFVPQLSKDS
jgi:hypothetical protein